MKVGDFIRLEYTGKIKETGKVFDTTNEEIAKKEGIYNHKTKYGPIPIIVGDKKIIKGVDEALLNMNIGEKKTIEIPPEKGFGYRNSKLIKIIPQSEFKKQKITPHPGMPISVDGILGRVMSVNSGRVKVDFNNPLAGKVLIYEVEIKEKIEDNEKKVLAICEYYGADVSKVSMEKNSVKIVLSKELPKNIKEKIADDIKKHINPNRIEFSEVFEENKGRNN